MLRVLDLFSGIGGFALGLESTGGFRTVAFCELAPFPREVLRRHWPDVPIHEDVRKLTGAAVGPVEVICGGFPCQDISQAGRGVGLHGRDSGLWFEAARLVGDLRPLWCVFENVGALRARGIDRVCSDLEGEGYSVWPLVVGAWAVGAPHKRDRVWILARSGGDARKRLADADGDTLRQQLERGTPTRGGDAEGADHPAGSAERQAVAGERGAPVVADADSRRPQGERKQDGDAAGDEHGEPSGNVAHGRGARLLERWPARPGEAQHNWEPPRLLERRLGRVPDGVSLGLVRLGVRRNREALKAFGNSLVPQIVAALGRAILRAEGLA